MNYYAGIDIGGTKINIGVFNKTGELMDNYVLSIPDDKSCSSVLDLAAEGLSTLCDRIDIDPDSIGSCGIGIPGTVSEDNLIARFAPNLGWFNEPVSKLFYEKTGISAKVLQDSRAGAYGEYISGSGQGANTLICITLGTGIGTGIVMNGKILNGALHSAGELGHFPAVENGRPCGCGKFGCLECYAAGKGLDKTAKELYGNSATARELFSAAEDGDADAVFAINQAVEMLGKTIVSAINLLSPDCLIFSGGLSAQRKLYLDPLVEYINSHCYHVEGQPKVKIALAKWKEHAPMVGAALFAKEQAVKKPTLSASVMCADMLNLGRELDEIARAGVGLIHIDVMDGHFVPNYMIPPEMIKYIKKGARVPLDIHLMVDNPDLAIGMIDPNPEDIITVHLESSVHIQRTLSLIHAKGARAGLAVNPGTPLTAITELLDDIDMLLIMTVNPGFAGQTLVPTALDKISRARKLLDSTGHGEVMLQVDGNCSFENIPKMHTAGADVFVVGTSSLFHKDYTYQSAANKIFDSLEG